MSALLRHPSCLSRRGAPFWPGTLPSSHLLVSLGVDIGQKGAGCSWIFSSPQHTKFAKLLSCWAGQPYVFVPQTTFQRHFRSIRLPPLKFRGEGSCPFTVPRPPLPCHCRAPNCSHFLWQQFQLKTTEQ